MVYINPPNEDTSTKFIRTLIVNSVKEKLITIIPNKIRVSYSTSHK